VTSHGLVLIPDFRSVSIYDFDANLVSSIAMPNVVNLLMQVVETSSGTFIVTYNQKTDDMNHISEVTTNGDIIRSYDAQRGEGEYQVINPRHIAIDAEDNIYFDDDINDRVLMLDSKLRLRRVIRYTGGWRGSPRSLCYSKDTRQLSVGLSIHSLDVWNISHE